MTKKLLMDMLVPAEQKNKKCTEIRYTRKESQKSVVLFLYPNLREREKNVNEKMFQRTAAFMRQIR